MSAVITAVVGSSLVGAGVGIYSSNKASGAQSGAANTAAGASYYATQQQILASQQAEERARADVAPWTQAGAAALGRLEGRIQAGPGEFIPEEQPGYRFGYQEFLEKPTLRSAAATGNLGGGAILKALTRYAQDYASTSYDNWLNRYYQSLEPEFRLAGMGGNAAVRAGNVSMQSAGQQGGAYQTGASQVGIAALAGGDARAGGYINTANAITGGINAGLQNWLLLRQLQSGGNLFGGSGVTDYGPSYYDGGYR